MAIPEIERAIDGGRLTDFIMETFPDWCEGDIRRIFDHIKEMPTLDVRPVVHGKWIWEDNENRFGWTCSECGYGIRADRARTNFCPDCAADMREVENDE